MRSGVKPGNQVRIRTLTFNRWMGWRSDAIAWFVSIAIALWLPMSVIAVPQPERDEPDLANLSLEDLMNIEITSVSKQPERLSDAAAAIYVITSEDIRRSGVTTLPEALRLAPGMHVARIDSNKWAISARGFNDRFTNKLLVLIDGRTVYTPFFSGVYWDAQDIMLENIDRIEVIRGPGAALWGANAVNGVINIITKDSRDTQGGMVTQLFGMEDQSISQFRYGGAISDNAFYRVYGRFLEHDEFAQYRRDYEAVDDWRSARGGARFDIDASDADSLMFQLELYDESFGSMEIDPILTAPWWRTIYSRDTARGGFLLGRWTHQLGEDSDYTLKLFYDRYDRNMYIYDEARDTVDIDFQHRFPWGDAQEWIWGLGYRFTTDEVVNSPSYRVSTMSSDDHLFSAFLQDKIELVPDRWTLTLGSRFERNDFTGFEVQPSARLMWSPSDEHRVWTSISRAVRTPSRAESSAQVDLETEPPFSANNPLPVPILAYGQGSDAFGSEELLAYELGYRWLPRDEFYFDLALFYHDYTHIRNGELGVVESVNDPLTPHAELPIWIDNNIRGESYGAEAAATWQALDWWTINLTYSALKMNLRVPNAVYQDVSVLEQNSSPRHQASLRNSFTLYDNVDLDLWLRYSGELMGFKIASYLEADARVAWRPTDDLEIAIGGQNLLHANHREFRLYNTYSFGPTSIERQAYVKVTWKF
ncbi:MAG: TonB-dependent receptor plug domain-containing protein [bacterium]|nr:TonB-dependent receptor plug domain-containing protein [bacterium]